MATKTRPYIVTNKLTGKCRLVRANNQAHAIRYVTSDEYEAEAATGAGVLDMLTAGVKPETASVQADDDTTTDVTEEAAHG